MEDTRKVAGEVGFPVAFGVTREMGDRIGAWWDERGNHIQPSEFVLKSAGGVIASCYSSSPIGRMDPQATLDMLTFLNQRARQR